MEAEMKKGRGAIYFFTLLALLLFSGNVAAGKDKVTLDKLLDQMTDLDWLYSPPFPGEKQVQFSSYERKSRIENGKQLDWFANADAGNYLGEEKKDGGTEYLMADYQGPGVITRVWSANPGKDRWRVYLDGASTPVIDEPGVELLSGRGKNFKAPFAGKRNMGTLLLFPIPFAKSCKVTLFTTAPQKPARYYQIDIVSLPQDREVETFKLADLKTYKIKIAEVAGAMITLVPNLPSQWQRKTIDVTIEPGAQKDLAELSGPGVVKMLELKISGTSKKAVRPLLNRTILSAKFDGLDQAAVYAPLGAFFGSTPGVNNYRSLPSSMEWDGKGGAAVLKSYWPMAFKNSAKFSVRNYSDQPLKISGTVVAEQKDLPHDALYFHTTYHFLEHHPTRPFVDWTLLAAQGGPGRYVGTMLSVRNPDYAWWGEGDEKVYADGENFPSVFGTGTEDYFSYAWGTDYKKFTHADYGISLAGSAFWNVALVPGQALPFRVIMFDPRLEEMVSQYRWHIMDQIPFSKSLRFDIEIWHWTPNISFDLQAVSYWYGDGAIKSEQPALEPDAIPNW
jgi:hypothetical protein